MQQRRQKKQQQQQKKKKSIDDDDDDDDDDDNVVSSNDMTNRIQFHLDGNDDDDDDDDVRNLQKGRKELPLPSQHHYHPQQRKKIIIIIMSVLTVVTLVLLILYIAKRNKYYNYNYDGIIIPVNTLLPPIITLYPIYLCIYTCIRHIILLFNNTQRSSRRSYMSHQPPHPPPQHPPQPMILIPKIIMSFTLIITVLSAQLPSYIGAGIATMCIIVFSIITRPSVSSVSSSSVVVSDLNNNNNSNNRSRMSSSSKKDDVVITFIHVVQSVIIMILVLLIENFLIWVVSATFIPSHSLHTVPPPLQDNLQAILQYIFHTILQLPYKSNVIQLRRLLNTQWALVACVGTSFVVTEIYHNKYRTLYGIANRAVMTVAVARFIRTISFIITVLPSQNIHCYFQRDFPNPPPFNNMLQFIWIGIIPRSHGGCNDLIISGHATIISTLACISTSITDDTIFAIALWSMVVMDFLIEIYEGFHYSVDMWLGIVLVTLLWNVLRSYEGQQVQLPTPSTSLVVTRTDKTYTAVCIPPPQQESLTIRSYVAYIIPGLVAYLQLIVISQDIANVVIVLYVASAVFVYIQFASNNRTNPYLRKWYIHYAQHILLCLVFMALGIYL